MSDSDALRRHQADSDWRACLTALRHLRRQLRAATTYLATLTLREEITYYQRRALSSRGMARTKPRM